MAHTISVPAGAGFASGDEMVELDSPKGGNDGRNSRIYESYDVNGGGINASNPNLLTEGTEPVIHQSIKSKIITPVLRWSRSSAGPSTKQPKSKDAIKKRLMSAY